MATSSTRPLRSCCTGAQGLAATSAACSVPGLVEQSVSVCPGAVPAPSVPAQGFTSSRPTLWAELIPSTAEEGLWGRPRRSQAGLSSQFMPSDADATRKNLGKGHRLAPGMLLWASSSHTRPWRLSGGSPEALRAAEGAGGGAAGRSPLPWRRHTELGSPRQSPRLVRAIMERFKGSSVQTRPKLPLPTPQPCPKSPEQGAGGSRERRCRQRMLTALMSWRAGSSSISRCMALDI